MFMQDMKTVPLKLFNPLKINTALNLSSTTIGYIKFHYQKSHQFNTKLAKKQSDFLVEFSQIFDVPLDTIDYYFAPTAAEIQMIKGFDYSIGDNGDEIPSGKADAKNRIVYSSGLNEYYPHEFIHILINPYYKNCHSWINEGVATYLGMSRGQTLDWHLHRLKDHLETHPEIDLNDMLKLMNMDQYTSYKYVLGGLIVKMAYDKGGYNLIKHIMSSGKTDDDFYKAVNTYLEIPKHELNTRLRTYLNTMD